MINLIEVRSRFELARMAGLDADEAGNGWDKAKLGALIDSWQDVAKLHDELKRYYERDIERYAADAEAGYDVTQLRAKPRRRMSAEEIAESVVRLENAECLYHPCACPLRHSR